MNIFKWYSKIDSIGIKIAKSWSLWSWFPFPILIKVSKIYWKSTEQFGWEKIVERHLLTDDNVELFAFKFEQKNVKIKLKCGVSWDKYVSGRIKIKLQIIEEEPSINILEFERKEYSTRFIKIKTKFNERSFRKDWGIKERILWAIWTRLNVISESKMAKKLEKLEFS